MEPAFDPASRLGPDGRRTVYFGAGIGLVETPVVGRGRLDASPRRGPLIIEEYEGTAVVPPDCRAYLDALGNVIIELDATPRAAQEKPA